MNILHLDSSARPARSDRDPHGSHTRRLGHRFLQRWRERRPNDPVRHRDVGQQPPPPVDARWVHAAFTPPAQRAPWMHEALALSDALVDELLEADLIVAGVPMYNFGMPAQFKAWIDNVVRVGRTFGFDRARAGEPYWPLLAGQGKRLVLLGARGDFGYEPGARLAEINHVEGGVVAAMRYIGIEQVHSIAVEGDEFADARLQASIAAAEQAVDALVDRLAPPLPAAAPGDQRASSPIIASV